jgi:restriction system-associated AAA family ATPase
MQLKRFKILTPFRGLPADYEIDLGNVVSEQKHSIEPLCFVGLNGSGKSNALEVLAEIFYYLEIYHKSDRKNIKDYRTVFGFEIDYYLPRLAIEMGRVEWEELSALWTALDNSAFIKIVKATNELPIISVTVNGTTLKVKNKNSNRNAALLPPRIVAYSSGMNELISNPFIKIDFHYFEDFNDKAGESLSSGLEMNRMFFMNFNSNELITLCNFLFAQSETYAYGVKMDALLEALRIKDLASFDITIQYKTPTNVIPKIPSELNLAINALRNCATFDELTVDKKGQELSRNLIFWVNDATKQAFQSNFRSAFELYRNLYFLNLLNINLFSKELRNQIRTVNSGVNLSDLLPKYENNKLLFHIGDLKFSKPETTEKVFYKHLSDGEHQLMQVMGTLLLMDTEGTLFILDEPETHFNPEWRSRFVSLLNECVEDDRKNQEVILTSHSPFIVSDCQPENVFIFSRNTEGGVQKPSRPKINTFGTSVSILTEEIFNKKETIADLSLSFLEEIKNREFTGLADIEKAKEDSRDLGESVEKVLLFRKLLFIEDKIKANLPNNDTQL